MFSPASYYQEAAHHWMKASADHRNDQYTAVVGIHETKCKKSKLQSPAKTNNVYRTP